MKYRRKDKSKKLIIHSANKKRECFDLSAVFARNDGIIAFSELESLIQRTI